MLLEKDKFLSKQKDVASVFNKHSGSSIDSSNRFRWPGDTSMPSGNDTINSIIKILAFHQSIKTIKKKFKIKSKFSFNHVSTDTIKRIVNVLDILDAVAVCINEALKTRSFPDSLKCANVRPIYEKVDLFDKNQGEYYHFYQKFMKE